MFTLLHSYLQQAFLVPKLIIIFVPDKTKTQKPKRIFHLSFGCVLWFEYSFSSRVYVPEAWPSGWR